MEKTKSLFVSMVGKTNVGKSSILNMLIGSKISITSPKPQTTRNRITGILTEENVQLVFIDTPGLHNPFGCLGEFMISEINNSLSDIEACLHVVEAGKSPSTFDFKLIEKFKKSNLKVILLINKIDLVKQKNTIMSQIDNFSKLFDYHAIIPVSATAGLGKSEIIDELKKLAIDSVFFFPKDDMTDQSERKLICEIVREKLLWNLDKELPHGTAVQIEKFSQVNDTTVSVQAVIYCERDNHKAIIVGAGGRMIKKVGIESRTELEHILGCKVNLNLFVKVKKDWRNKPGVLRELGYC